MKGLIAVPNMGMIPANTTESLVKLTYFTVKNLVNMHLETRLDSNTLIHLARESAAEYAVNNGFDWLIFIDSDMIVPQNLIVKLLEADKDIVCGLYFMRKPPFYPTIFDRYEFDEKGNLSYFFMKDWPTEQLFEVEAVGTGAMMIKTDALKNIPQPWFDFMGGVGEDMSFCYRARKQNIKIFIDPTTRIGHIQQTAVYEEQYRGWDKG